MYHADGVTTHSQLRIRTRDGVVMCAYKSYTGYAYGACLDPATTTFAEFRDTGKAVALYPMCGRHTGTVKMNVRKGSYSFRGMEPIAAQPNSINHIGVVEQMLTDLTNQKQHEKEAYQARREEQELANTREHWAVRRADYNAVPTSDFKPGVSLVDPKVDDWRRVYINVHVRQLTPNQARAVAAALMQAASDAEDQTSVAMMP